MKLSAFDYELPPELIAQHPAAERPDSRLLVFDRDSGGCELRTFRDLPAFVRPGDCLVLNDTRVIPARLLGRRLPGGGRVEALLIEETAPGEWDSLLRPGARMRPGSRLRFGDGADEQAEVLGRHGEGVFRLRFATPRVLELLDRRGRVPLPPYITRDPSADDAERYQTVYASVPGAVAAPTAGLHFTPEMLNAVRRRGVGVAAVTLHVGPGTFQPVKTEDIERHRMHEERFELPAATARAVNAARCAGGRVIAVGTTAVRVLESCWDAASGQVVGRSGRTRLFLHPPQRPCAVDGLLTNFHLPRSTLLMLVCTFGSVESVLAAYRLAVRERLRFFSYGDCMLLLPGPAAAPP